MIRWDFTDLLKEGVGGANLVFGALLSAYIGVSIPSIPNDVRFDQLVVWFVAMFWFVFGLNLTFFAMWSRGWKALVGYLFVVIFSAQFVVRSAAQLGLNSKVLAAIFSAWALVLLLLAYVLYSALRKAGRRAQ